MIGLLILLLWGLSPAWALSPDEAARLALTLSPAVAEAEAELLRAQGALRAATGLPGDPRVSASTAVVGEVWQLSVSQPVSLSGAGLADRRAAQAALDAAQHRQRRAALELVAEARRAWAQAVVAQQQAQLAAQSLEVSQRIAQASARRAEVGEGSALQRDVAALQLEEARASWMRAAVAEAQALSRLSALTGVPIEALTLTSDPLAAAPAPEGGQARSDLLAADAERAAAQAALRREQASTLAPLQLGAFVEEEDGALRAGPRVTLTLPVWQRNADGRADAQAALATSTARLAAAERAVAAEQQSSGALLEALEAAASGQPEDLPTQAARALDAVAFGYEQGELDLLTADQLRGRILAGQSAWLEARGLLAEARLERALAVEDGAALGL